MDQGSPMAKKAATMIDVLKRRGQIENYLTNLKVERMKEDSVIVYNEPPKPVILEQAKKEEKPQATNEAITKKEPVKAGVDSSQFKKPAPAAKTPAGFTFKPTDQHYVAIVLEKVDIVYGNEARNAFNRYNQENYYSQQIEMSILPIDDTHKLILMSSFTDAVAALDYVEKAKRIAGAQIVPWLAADKYSFMIIGAENLEVLKNNKDLAAYKKFLLNNYPGKF